MVRQYAPDWTSTVVWPNGSGGNYTATLLGTKQPDAGRSDDKITVVRTLVTDVDADGKVQFGQLVEFASPDLIDRSQFQHYVKQWLKGDFEDTKMLAVEYTIGYAFTQAFLHMPDKSEARPIMMKLERKSGVGKVEAIIYCYVSDIDIDKLCRKIDGIIDMDTCVPFIAGIEITCVIYIDGGGGGDLGGGGGDEDDGDQDGPCENDDGCDGVGYGVSDWSVPGL